ncbi:MAG TPA: DUF4365 domain-containing protein, partial [Actinomycetota bacterium]|nr:DUF4365 domain-containing protein [Actinomycetota bacterium]
MHVAETHQRGSAGRSQVDADFEWIGWGVIRNSDHDVGNGIDLFLLARGERLHDSGRMVTAQVKSGPSFFDRPARENGQVTGWWFGESDDGHLKRWLTQPFPHLVVIHDVETRISYWVHVRPDAVVRTGQGWKILVPANQKVDRESLPDLRAIAARAPATYEGAVWTGRLEGLADDDRWRYALVAPRLVAPHPNSGIPQPLVPEQATAMLLQGRAGEFANHAREEDSVPDLAEARDHQDWGWRFVGGMHQLLSQRSFEAFEQLAAEAPTVPARVAASAVLSAAYARAEVFAHSAALVRSMLEVPHLLPVDRAWLHVHLARALREANAQDEALALIGEAEAILSQIADDPVAAAMRASAAMLWWRLTWLEGADIAKLVTALDTRVRWWSTDSTVGALDKFLRESFEEGTVGRPLELAAGDPGSGELVAAEVAADLRGDVSQAQWLAVVRARQHVALPRQHDEAQARYAALNDLRRVGADKPLDQALRALWRSGPLEEVARLAETTADVAWTRTNWKTNLVAWRRAADVMPAAAAASA